MLPHYCYVHPRNDFRSFKLSEGHLIRGNKFICHACFRRMGRDTAILQAKAKTTPLEKRLLQLLDRRKCRFKRNYRIGKFKFDVAIPRLRLLIETDGGTFHKKEKPPEDGVPKPLREGTRAWVVHHNDWKLIRIRNGPDFEERLGREIEQAMTGS